jgi:hypothetical protein
MLSFRELGTPETYRHGMNRGLRAPVHLKRVELWRFLKALVPGRTECWCTTTKKQQPPRYR